MIGSMGTINIGTFRELLEHGYSLTCWCAGCSRLAACDLAMLVRNGLGDRQITRCKPKCRKRGSLGLGFWPARNASCSGRK